MALQYEHIILAANWDAYSEPGTPNYIRLLDTIDNIVNENKKVTLIFSLPMTTSENLHRLKLLKASDFVFFNEEDDPIIRPIYKDSQIVKDIKQRFPSINFIDLKDVMCENKQCDLILNDVIVYRNNDHLNTIGAKLIAEKYLMEFGNPLKSATFSK